MIRHSLLFLSLVFSLIIISAQAVAESYRYMDEGGNIYFVDRMDQVPFRYRNQIPALVTPVGVIDKKMEARRAQEKAREKAKQEARKENERKKRERQLQKKYTGKKYKVTPAEATKIAEERLQQDQERARKQAEANAERDPNGFLPSTIPEVKGPSDVNEPIAE